MNFLNKIRTILITKKSFTGKKTMLLLFLIIAVVACKKDTSKNEKQHIVDNLKSYTINQIMDNEAVFGGSFSPDNSNLLVTSNKSGIYNIYKVPTGGGDFEPLTKSDSSSVFGISYFPNDERMLFRMDNNGDEVYHIYLRDTTGITKELTAQSGARATFYGWAHDSNSFYFGYTKRNPRFTDVYEMDINSLEPKMIYQNDSAYSFGGISNDKKHMMLSKAITTNDSDLFIYSFDSKSLTKVNKERSANSAADFSPDSKSLYYTTDLGSEFAYLMKYDISAQSHDKVMEKEWDINSSFFTHDGKYQITYVNADAKTEIEVIEVASGKKMDFPTFETGDVSSVSFSRDGTKARFYVRGSNTPSNLYSYDVASKEYKKISDVLNKDINPVDMVTAKVVRYKSFDGLEIPAIYYTPHQASTENKVPALVWVHGGPGGQSRQNFSPLIQYLVNHGYAILAVNNRGSSGYGKTFFQMDDQNHGEKDLQDCVEGKNWLAQQPEINAERIGIIGGSYGGYMTMAALTFTPEEFDVGVNIFGVTNWLRTLKSIPPWWETFKDALYKEMGDPNTIDSVRLHKVSPLFHTDKVTKPLMVLQGAKDPRVLQVESDEIVAGVKKNGVPVEYVLFEDEGHGFVKKENQIEAYGKILEFLNKHLGYDEPVKE